MPTSPLDPQFPEWFPPGCPPGTAEGAAGVVFRFIAGDAVAPGDFLSHHELGLAPRAHPCRRCSLSVYRTLGFALGKLRELRDRFPGRFGSHVAAGRLTPEHGKLLQAGADPDHHEWWAYAGVDRSSPFQVVARLED